MKQIILQVLVGMSIAVSIITVAISMYCVYMLEIIR